MKITKSTRDPYLKEAYIWYEFFCSELLETSLRMFYAKSLIFIIISTLIRVHE